MAPMDGSVQSLRRLLIDAVNDISERGYTSEQQLDIWLRRLRTAAERELGADAASDAEVRRALEAIYKRLVDGGGVLKALPGVSRYTLAMIRPDLQAELDRRIRASADLIKLNRAEAMSKTLARFSGWATSVPAGGSETVDRIKVREHIAKPTVQQRYEARRCSVDQGHKLAANVSEIAALGNGAIGGTWRHAHRGSEYQSRPEHVKRDGEVFLISDSWAQKEGLIKKAGHRYIDEIERPGEFVFCSCAYTYIFSPRRLPEECLTEKGRDWIAKGKAMP